MTPYMHVLHMLGVTLWIGGVVAVGLVGAMAAGEGKVLAAARHASLRVATPGMVMAFAGGLTMFVMGIDAYKSAGWLHAKITLALIAAALSGVLSGKLRKAAAGAEVAPGTFKKLAGGVLLIAFLNIFLVFFGPRLMG